jgi:hypothetical protein
MPAFAHRRDLPLPGIDARLRDRGIERRSLVAVAAAPEAVLAGAPVLIVSVECVSTWTHHQVLHRCSSSD